MPVVFHVSESHPWRSSTGTGSRAWSSIYSVTLSWVMSNSPLAMRLWDGRTGIARCGASCGASNRFEPLPDFPGLARALAASV